MPTDQHNYPLPSRPVIPLLPLSSNLREPLLHGRFPEEEDLLEGPRPPSLLVQRLVLLVDVVEVVVVDVHKGPLDVAQALQLPLQRLPDVVRHLQGQAFVHHHVDLDVVFLAGVVCPAL